MTDQTIQRGERIAVVGATGYVGGRLVPALLNAGHRVRCLARDARKAGARPWAHHPDVEIAECALDDPDQVRSALDDCAAAYYLIHAMVSGGSEFARVDEELARTFGDAAAHVGVRRLIYLGGLGDEAHDLSEHLASRRHVETALRESGVPLTTLRAAMIIGSGSASFEILRYLVERLPVMVTPCWVRTRSQPIAIRDVLRYLVSCLAEPATSGRTLDIGGPDVLSYHDLMRLMAEVLELPRRLVIPVNVLTPRLSSRWIHIVTPISHKLARPLAEGLRNELVCRDQEAQRLLPGPCLTARESISRAVAVHRAGETPTSWSDAGPMPGDPTWAGGAEFRDERTRIAWATPDAVFRALCRIGGDTGYFGAGALWKLRGLLDRCVGGPGLRRGRRDPNELRFGDAVDFWRVAEVEPARRLELVAEMRLPGDARLRWTLEPRPGGRTLVTQTAVFRPKGLLGLAYWWAVFPMHGFVFDGMLRGLCRTAEAVGDGPPRKRPRGRLAILYRETTVPTSLDETFAFFSNAENLDRLTPSWVGFQILTPTPIEMHPGRNIDYRIRIRGVPVKWRTEIAAWKPNEHFTDVQIKGPYRWWHHEHRFEPSPDGGTRVIDEVEYLAPFAWLTHPLLVRRDVRRIFDHRAEQLRKILAKDDVERSPAPGTPAAHIVSSSTKSPGSS